MEHIRTAFDAIASEYDAQRQHVIPELDTFYGTAVWAADWPSDHPRILDIGAGTGLLSALLLQRYPEASLTALDISEQMLNVAKKRFAGNPNVRYITGDYVTTNLGGRYDLICSALSIHHLIDKDKRNLYQRIYETLNPKGVFVNADQAAGETLALDRYYMQYWDAIALKAVRICSIEPCSSSLIRWGGRGNQYNDRIRIIRFCPDSCT